MNYNNYEIMLIKTKRLILKKGTMTDYLKVYEYDFTKLRDIDGIIEYVKSSSDEIIKSFKKGDEHFFKQCKKNHMFDWIIYYKKTPIGNVLADQEDLSNKSIEITINIHPSSWNKGYATETLNKVIDYLMGIGYDKIIMRYVDGESKIKHICEKLGFKPYLINKDSFAISNDKLDEYIVIMTKEDWFSKTGKITIVNKVLS